MKEAYHITADGTKTIIAPVEILFLSDRDIVELVLPEGCKTIWCYYNNLTELIIPKGCEGVYCYNNQLTELVLPEGCKTVYCYDNPLTELLIPEGCKYIYCDLSLIEKHYDQWKDLDTIITNR